MPSIKELKKRIVTVKNTQQTTKAMKMVSAAKLRRAQDAITAHRPYAKKLGELIRLVSSMSATQYSSPLIGGTNTAKGGKVLLVLVTSDRGLCGAFNGNVFKRAQAWVNQNKANYQAIDLAFVGRKSFEFFKNRGLTKADTFYEEFGRKATFESAKKTANWAIAQFEAGKYDRVYFIYNEFKNAISQVIVVENFLPIQPETAQVEDSKSSKADAKVDLFLVKPSTKEVLDRLLAKHFAVQAYRILLESQASEHGARMSAMENATKNAGDMMKELTLSYNKQRQAGITKELLEIISGSESQKG
ncbi:MAG: ATP synthase F1 subunit gamma [Bacteriovoracia bacterium]